MWNSGSLKSNMFSVLAASDVIVSVNNLLTELGFDSWAVRVDVYECAELRLQSEFETVRNL